MVQQHSSGLSYHYRLLCFLLSRVGFLVQQKQQHQKPRKELELHIAASMIDPLQFEQEEAHQQAEFEVLEHDPALAEIKKQFFIQGWSVNDVLTWLQHVPFNRERIEECTNAFRIEGIDGSKLLSLQRNSQACSGMTDSEWLLLHAARESLLEDDNICLMPSESQLNSSFSLPSTSPPCGQHREDDFSILYEQSRVQSSKSLTLEPAQRSGSFMSYLRFLSFPRQFWSPNASKHEQIESTATEVFSLQEEVLCAEEREAALQAKMDHLDEILRTARLASYLYTRMRWTPLPGELPVDDADVDDWLQRFIVLEGSSLFFYSRAADFSPQGAILFKEVVDIGAISGQIQHEQDNIEWFGFHITTCEGLRFECATPLKLQAELWMSSIQGAHSGQCPQEVIN